MYFLIAAVIGAVTDLASKYYVFAVLSFDTQDTIPLIDGWLDVTQHINRGGIWGMAQGYNALLIALTSLIIPLVAAMAFSCRAPNAPLWALGLLMGGAVGNLYDRIRYDGVRDFIDLHWGEAYRWPVFNIADAWIVIGVLVYVGWSLLLAPHIEPEQGGDAEANPQEETA